MVIMARNIYIFLLSFLLFSGLLVQASFFSCILKSKAKVQPEEQPAIKKPSWRQNFKPFFIRHNERISSWPIARQTEVEKCEQMELGKLLSENLCGDVVHIINEYAQGGKISNVKGIEPYNIPVVSVPIQPYSLNQFIILRERNLEIWQFVDQEARLICRGDVDRYISRGFGSPFYLAGDKDAMFPLSNGVIMYAYPRCYRPFHGMQKMHFMVECDYGPRRMRKDFSARRSMPLVFPSRFSDVDPGSRNHYYEEENMKAAQHWGNNNFVCVNNNNELIINENGEGVVISDYAFEGVLVVDDNSFVTWGSFEKRPHISLWKKTEKEWQPIHRYSPSEVQQVLATPLKCIALCKALKNSYERFRAEQNYFYRSTNHPQPPANPCHIVEFDFLPGYKGHNSAVEVEPEVHSMARLTDGTMVLAHTNGAISRYEESQNHLKNAWERFKAGQTAAAGTK